MRSMSRIPIRLRWSIPPIPSPRAIPAWSPKLTSTVGFASRKPMRIVATTDVPERSRHPGCNRKPADHADLLRRLAIADEGCRPLQHVYPRGLSDEFGKDSDLVPVRGLVRRCEDALCQR